MAKKIAEGSTLGLRYEIFDRTGVVDQSDTRSETEVQGSVSGGYGAGGYTAPIVGSVSSTTTRFQNIYLTDDEGKEHNIDLRNFVVPCRSGQRLTIFLLTHGKRKFGSYFKALNRNTGEVINHQKAVRSEMYPWRSVLIVVGILLLLAFFNIYSEPNTGFVEALFYTAIGIAIVGVPVWFVGWLIANVRGLAVINNPSFKAHVSQLRQARESKSPANIKGSVTA